MKLIIGLGNPGREYKNTRHNFGFRVIDALRNDLQLSNWQQEKRLNAMVSRGTVDGTVVILAKPTTFMNKSGDAVKALVDEYEPSEEELIIVHDDADVPFGSLRLEKNRGAGGHHGVESSISHLGGNDFQRLRLGIRTPERDASNLTDYALKSFRPEEEETMSAMIADAIETLKTAL